MFDLSYIKNATLRFFVRRYICDCLYFGVLTVVFIHMGICNVAFSRLYTCGIIRHKRTAAHQRKLTIYPPTFAGSAHVIVFTSFNDYFCLFSFGCKPNVDFFLFQNEKKQLQQQFESIHRLGFFG